MNTMMSFRLYCESKGWFDRWGRFNADRLEPSLDPQSNNNLLYHAEYLAVLDLWDDIQESDGDKLEKIFALHEVKPGLLKRDPDSGMAQKHDDILGVACAAAITGRFELAQKILAYLRANEWEIDVLDPTGAYEITLDVSRIGGFEQTIELCAGESLGLWSQALLGITLVAGAYKRGGESGPLMDWLTFRAAKAVLKRKPEQNPYVLKFFMSWFESRMKKDPLAMGSRFARYFPINGKMHPMAMFTFGKV